MSIIAQSQINNDILKERIYAYTLYPGLELFILPKKGYNKKYASFATKFGSIDSKFKVRGEDNESLEVPDGVAHFLEHKLFEEERGNVFDEFARLGASANAYTNFTMTNYLFSTADNFDDCFALLINFVQAPFFNQESVEKEKGIIEQEILMYQDNPHWRLFFNLLGALYQNHPVRKDIAGSVESIKEIDKEVLYKCYQTFYHPSNMALFVVGDLNPEEIRERVEKNLEERNYSLLGEIERIYPQEPSEVNKKIVKDKMEVSQDLLNLGFKDREIGLDGMELFKKELITDLLLEIILGRSSELYDRLYEGGLINDSFGASFVAEKDYSYVIVGGETPDPDKLYRSLLSGIKEYQEKGIGEEDFKRQQRKMLGEFLRNFNSLEFIANNFLAYYFRNINLFDYVEVLLNIQKGEVQERLARLFQEDYHACSIIYAEK